MLAQYRLRNTTEMYSNDPFYAHFAQDSELELTALKPLVEVGNVEDSIITNMILYDD